MMLLKTAPLKDIVISAHALARAKQRIDLKVDKNDIQFEFKLKELLKNAEFREISLNKMKYELIYENKKYEIVASELPNNKIIVNTIICKEKNKNDAQY